MIFIIFRQIYIIFTKMLTNPRDLREYKEVDKIPMSMLQSIFSLHQKGQVYVGGRDAPVDQHFIVKAWV